MKKTLFAMLILFALAPAATIHARAEEQSAVYAYMPQQTVLYDSSGSPVCTLPATYFTVVCGEKENGNYPVCYLDISGYVKAEDITLADYEPVTKFPLLHARPHNDGMAVNLRDKPNNVSGAVLAAVPADAELFLYGEVTGTEMIAGAGNVWQYVRYDLTEPLYGYVYSPQLDCDKVKPNVIEKVTHAVYEPIEEPADTELTKAGRFAFIAAMCVPAAILTTVLFYRPKSTRIPRHKES